MMLSSSSIFTFSDPILLLLLLTLVLLPSRHPRILQVKQKLYINNFSPLQYSITFPIIQPPPNRSNSWEKKLN